MSVQSWFNRVWYRRSPPPRWLMPFAAIYAAATASRRWLYRHGLCKSTQMPCPVVVVGNLSVGGAGKTPLVAWLAARLAESGRRPGIASRGYRGSAAGARLVAPSDDAAAVGDEPLLLARRTRLPVAVCRTRTKAARLLIEAGCDVIVSDDGLQHYALGRDCEIIVIDGDRRFGNGWSLPAGPLRERPTRLAQADAVVVNGASAGPGQFTMRLEADRAVALRGGSAAPLDAFKGVAVHAVAGIANPERFFRMLRARGIEVIAHPLDDHARIGGNDIRFADGKPVLMTEKDAVKCANLADERHWYVPVDASFGGDDAAALWNIVMRSLGRRGAAAGR